MAADIGASATNAGANASAFAVVPAARQVAVIINPAAGGGRGLRLAKRIRASFAKVGVHDVWLTTHPGHERELATEAIGRGCTTIAVAGGDGTLSHVANAILISGHDVRLAPIPIGSGNDFVRSLRITARSLAAMARACLATNDHRIDVGLVEQAYFLNSCGFGFDVAVLQTMARSPRLRGRFAYLVAALRQIRSFPGISAAIGDAPTFRHLLILAANAPRFGGSFIIAPGASMYDGAIDLIELWNSRASRMRLKLLFAAIRGRHLRYLRNARATQARAMTVRFDVPPLCQTDGEVWQVHSTAVTVRCVPGALRVVGAPPPPKIHVPRPVQRVSNAARRSRNIT